MERDDLLNALSDAMRGNADPNLLSGRVRAGQVKSRLIEAHAPEPSADGAAHLLQSVAESAGLALQNLGDDVWVLTNPDDAFFVDTLNSRFWLLHATASADKLRRLLRRHMLPSAQLDHAWFSRDQLQMVEGERRWVRSSFRSDQLQPNDSGAAVPRRWRVQVEGEDPDELLRLVSQNPRYEAGAALTAVGSLLREAGMGRAEVAADYQGGFVASGTDFHLVAGLLWRTLDRYESYVRGLEQSYQLSTTATKEMGLAIDGDVAFVEFPHEVMDLDALVANLFTSKEPFRLWAVPREVTPGQWEANAVDLHVGQPLRLELTSRWLRVLLGPHTCGNTLARLVANLQHRFDARLHIPLPAAA